VENGLDVCGPARSQPRLAAMQAVSSSGHHSQPPAAPQETAFCAECHKQHAVDDPGDWQSRCEHCGAYTRQACRPQPEVGSSWCRTCKEAGTLAAVNLSSIDERVVRCCATTVKEGLGHLVSDLSSRLGLNKTSGVMKVRVHPAATDASAAHLSASRWHSPFTSFTYTCIVSTS
jgi:hypothetical protein